MARGIPTGVDLHVKEGGSGTPTLLFLHGLGANGDVWNGMEPILREQWQGRWIIPDLRGHGRSGHQAPYSYGGHAADMAALLGQDEETVVVGHSMGGVVALALATGWYGMQIRHAAAFGIKIKWTADEEAKLRQLARAAVRWFDTQAEAVDRYLKVSGLIGLIDPAAPEAVSGIRQEGERFRLASDPMINAVIGPKAEEFVAAAKAPVRLAAGAKDPMVSLADMQALDPQALVFDGLGHNAHVERPGAVWQFVRGALS
jgi:pimeloyl-ACP methyl ester carboxylesterase